MSRPDLALNGDIPATEVYAYKTQDGKLVSYVARYDMDGKKTFRQYTVWSSPDGKKNWYSKGMAGDCPLFGLADLVEHPDSPVLLTEGEKCAIHAANAFPEYVSVTSMGGSGAIAKTDFSHLAGRDVIIMPDNDAPGAKAAKQFEVKLIEAGAARVRILNISEIADLLAKKECRAGFDIADAIDLGFDAGCLQDAIEDPSMMVDGTIDHPHLPADIVLRELYVNCQLEPDLPDDFTLNADGIFKTVYDSKGNPETVFVGSPLAVIGRTFHAGGSGWGYHIVLRSPDNKWVPLTLRGRLFASCGKELREILAENGFVPPQCLKGRRALSEFISFWQDCPIIEHTTQLGWVGESFALPGETIQPAGAEKKDRSEFEQSAKPYPKERNI